MEMFYALLGLCLAGSALAQVPNWGPCPEIVAMPDFDSSKFMGKWYEAQRYFTAFEFSAKCVIVEYSPGENGTIEMIASAISGLTGHLSSMEAVVHVPNSAEPAKLKVKIPSAPVAGDLWILGTDYESYAVLYSCTNLELANFQYVWFITREQNPSKDIINKAVKVMEKHRLHKKWLMKTEQNDCEVEIVEEIPEDVPEPSPELIEE